MTFRLHKGDIEIRKPSDRKAVGQYIDRLVKRNPIVRDIDFARQRFITWKRRQKKISSDFVVQVTGDANRKIYLNVYSTTPVQLQDRSAQKQRQRIPIQSLWDEYHQVLTRLYEKDKFPIADISKGYAFYKEPKLNQIQKRIIEFSNNETEKLIDISRHDPHPERRGMANGFLSFVQNPRIMRLLASNAQTDRDHFAHNMAAQSLLTRLESKNVSPLDRRRILRGLFRLYSHPSTICRNKALLAIEIALRKRVILRLMMPENLIKFVERSAQSNNPILREPAGQIQKRLGRREIPPKAL